MATVIFYNFILFSSTFFVWISEKGKGNLERYFFLGIAFLLVFVPAAIRYDIGTDYLSYVEIFENPNRLDAYKYSEPIFYFVNWFYQRIGAHSQWVIATLSFIFTVVAFKSYPRKNAWLIHYIFFSMLWFFSFNGIRQAVAIAFVLLALSLYIENRRISFFILVVVGSLFHQSVIVVAFIGLIAMVPFGPIIKTKLVPFIFIVCIGLTFLFTSYVIYFIEWLLNLTGFEQYVRHFSNDKHFAERDFGTGYGVVVSLFFSMYIITRSNALINSNEDSWLLILIVFLYSIMLTLAGSIIIFERALLVFLIGIVLSVYVLFDVSRIAFIDKVVCTFFLLFLMLSFIKNSMGIETSYSNPKRNPYQTILNVEG